MCVFDFSRNNNCVSHYEIMTEYCKNSETMFNLQYMKMYKMFYLISEL